jgi:hypothetical protein
MTTESQTNYHAAFCAMYNKLPSECDHGGLTCAEYMRTLSKPYEPSESVEAFAMLQAMPSVEIPYPELCLRFVNLELQHQTALQTISILARQLEHERQRIDTLYAMPHNTWKPDYHK